VRNNDSHLSAGGTEPCGSIFSRGSVFIGANLENAGDPFTARRGGLEFCRGDVAAGRSSIAETGNHVEKMGPLNPTESQSGAAPVPEMAPIKPTVTYDDFEKIDLRVAKVISCEPVPKSKKLLKLQIEIGSERRQIVAGIAQQRTPEELIGKNIIVVANLEPAKLMGVESQGMLLATHGEGTAFALLTVTNDVPSGNWIK
jgi:methionyl-tRNA synthetase